MWSPRKSRKPTEIAGAKLVRLGHHSQWRQSAHKPVQIYLREPRPKMRVSSHTASGARSPCAERDESVCLRVTRDPLRARLNCWWGGVLRRRRIGSRTLLVHAPTPAGTAVDRWQCLWLTSSVVASHTCDPSSLETAVPRWRGRVVLLGGSPSPVRPQRPAITTTVRRGVADKSPRSCYSRETPPGRNMPRRVFSQPEGLRCVHMVDNKVAYFAGPAHGCPITCRRRVFQDVAVNSVPEISSEYCAELLVFSIFLTSWEQRNADQTKGVRVARPLIAWMYDGHLHLLAIKSPLHQLSSGRRAAIFPVARARGFWTWYCCPSGASWQVWGRHRCSGWGRHNRRSRRCGCGRARGNGWSRPRRWSRRWATPSSAVKTTR